MKTILTAMLLSTVAFTTALQAKPVAYLITADMGGAMPDYFEKAEKMQGNKVIIDGACFSACTLYVRTDFMLDYCLTDRAVLGFHKPYQIDPVKHTPIVAEIVARMADDVWQTEFANKMLPALGRFLQKQYIPSVSEGASPGLFLALSTSSLSEIMPVCEDDWQTEYDLRPVPTAGV